ncbi:MAG: bacterial Ig-like domain-containing protein [Oscillospiraceae bacterium]|nr:bacterial Ig-like domain-containing protein [Oscillospiraceae bacterium]
MFTEIPFSNVVYEYHSYIPWEFVGQTSSSVYRLTYPQENMVLIPEDAKTSIVDSLNDASQYNNTLSNTWQTINNSNPEAVSNSNINYGDAEIYVNNLASNTKVYVDEIKVSEYDKSNNFIQDVFFDDFSNDFDYNLNDSAGTGIIQHSTNEGYLGTGAKIIQGPTSNASVFGYYLTRFFKINPNNKYQVSIRVKVENPGPNTLVQPRIVYFHGDGITPFDKTYIEAEVQPYIDYSNQKNVPIFMGEYGADSWCFKELTNINDGTLYTNLGNLGGEQWTDDMLSFIIDNELNSSYWAYSSPYGIGSFELYSGDYSGNKTYINEYLENAFINYFGGTPAISGEISIVPDTTDIVTGLGITVNWPDNIDGLTKQISIDGGNTFTTYTGKVTMTANGTVIARLVDGDNNVIKVTSLTITNIAKAVTTIAVKMQPTKLSYVEGQTLDLTGLVVTLTYNDSTTKDVTYTATDFTNNGITANPANGASLTVANHNAKPVTLTCSGKTVNTSNLTVTTATTGFFYTSGKEIMDSTGAPYVIKSIGITNDVWRDPANGGPGGINYALTDPKESDYQKLQALGFNAVRFCLRYTFFQDSKGFQLIDQNIAWAKKYGISIILDMHVPNGGAQERFR